MRFHDGQLVVSLANPFAQIPNQLVQSFKLLRMNGLQVKKPAESQMPWDDYKVLATIPGEQAFQPLSKSKCSLVKNP